MVSICLKMVRFLLPLGSVADLEDSGQGIVAGLLVQNTLKYLLQFGLVSRYLVYARLFLLICISIIVP